MEQSIVTSELIKLYGLIRPNFRSFPVGERDHLLHDIKREIRNALRYSSIANSVSSMRLKSYQEVQGSLHLLSLYYAIAHDQKIVKYKFYLQISTTVVRIEAMVSNAIRAIVNKKAPKKEIAQ